MLSTYSYWIDDLQDYSMKYDRKDEKFVKSYLLKFKGP